VPCGAGRKATGGALTLTPCSKHWDDRLGHVHRVLSAAVRMVHLVSQQGLSVLVHCSDGWDRTAQLAGLAMLLMDPYYRTLKVRPHCAFLVLRS
jgi:hypothetical protein